MRRTQFLAALSLVAATCLVAPAVAQSDDASQQTAEQLQQMFEKQKTRGLVIAPATGSGGASAAVNAEEMAKATVYTPVDSDTEINVRISFDFDSALLREDQKPKLTTLCEAVSNMKGQVFRIVGHTDAKGTEAYNEKLSLLRAEEVKRYMVGTCGIEGNRLLAIGAGETHPVQGTDPVSEENRRVEFQLIS